jgi:uncharacterized protein YjbI with pentapeptide repeats
MDEFENDFRRATFCGEAAFGGAFFKSPTAFARAKFKGLASFTDAIFAGVAKFYSSTFLGEAHFHMTTFMTHADFAESSFGSAVAFSQVGFGGNARFANVTFRGEAEFRWSVFKAQARFNGAKFKAGADFRLVRLPEGADFSDASIRGPHFLLDSASVERFLTMLVRTSRLSCIGTRFTAGGHFRLDVPTEIVLEGTEFPVPFIISGQSRLANQPKVLTLQRANASGLAMTGVDLTKCHFANAHGLDRLRIEGSVHFAVPPKRWNLTSRQVLAEEQDWRARHRKREGWSRVEWPEWLPKPQRLEPHQIAPIYRSLRKAWEDNKDEPGAADFYYGEMEMRRLNSRTPWPERVILWLYWLVSGYGLRGLRALAWLAAVVVGLAALLQAIGFNGGDPGFRDAVIYAAQSTVSVASGNTALTEHVSWAGEVLRIVLRLAGPLLLGLALLAVRNRVKR